jgi:uncharacterized protein YacL (UPF0231 family)
MNLDKVLVKMGFDHKIIDNADQDEVRGRKNDFKSVEEFQAAARAHMNELIGNPHEFFNIRIETLILTNKDITTQDFNSIEGLELDIDEWYVADCELLLCSFCDTEKNVMLLKDKGICETCQAEMKEKFGALAKI